MGVVNNEGPLKGGIKSSSPDGQGFLSSSVLKGQTSFRTFFYGSEFDVLNCFAGHPGKGTTGATAGGLPSFDPNQGSCKANYYHSNSLQVLVNSTGQPGLAGAAATTCWGGAGGFGGAANNGYGAGGRGGSGG